MNTALVLIDIQKDYFPQGKMKLVGAEKASQLASKLLSAFGNKNLPVAHVQHISSRAGAAFFLPGTEGVNFHPDVMPLENEVIIEKHFPNSFRQTNLLEWLESKNIKKLVICGMMSHMCIDSTVRAAFDLGYFCTPAHDACATRDLMFNEENIEASKVHGAHMAALGSTFARIISCEEIIQKLQK